MQKLASTQLLLGKSAKKGKQESLTSLFRAAEAFKRMEVLASAEEGTRVKLVLEGLGKVQLKLGSDIEKGQHKTIMTLFWYEERVKPIMMQRSAEAGEAVTVTLWKI